METLVGMVGVRGPVRLMGSGGGNEAGGLTGYLVTG